MHNFEEVSYIELIGVFNQFLVNGPFMEKPDIWFAKLGKLGKYVYSPCGKVTFEVNMQINDLHV